MRLGRFLDYASNLIKHVYKHRLFLKEKCPLSLKAVFRVFTLTHFGAKAS